MTELPAVPSPRSASIFLTETPYPFLICCRRLNGGPILARHVPFTTVFAYHGRQLTLPPLPRRQWLRPPDTIEATILTPTIEPPIFGSPPATSTHATSMASMEMALPRTTRGRLCVRRHFTPSLISGTQYRQKPRLSSSLRSSARSRPTRQVMLPYLSPIHREVRRAEGIEIAPAIGLMAGKGTKTTEIAGLVGQPLTKPVFNREAPCSFKPFKLGTIPSRKLSPNGSKMIPSPTHSSLLEQRST